MNIVACISRFVLLSNYQVIHQQQRYSITGEIQLTEKIGTVYLFLIDSAYLKKPGSGLDTIIVEVTYERIAYEFTGISKGVYGMRCFQDLNGNRKLDKGLLGPEEPWALTWNGEKRFPPRFEDISFQLSGDVRMDLTLKK